MTSRGTTAFWKLYRDLPADVKAAARKAYRTFRENPAHPSLRLERLACDRRAWALRLTLNYRAVAWRADDVWVWFWIGTHQDFDRQFPRR